jgi:hypothetical protein
LANLNFCHSGPWIVTWALHRATPARLRQHAILELMNLCMPAVVSKLLMHKLGTTPTPLGKLFEVTSNVDFQPVERLGLRGASRSEC